MKIIMESWKRFIVEETEFPQKKHESKHAAILISVSQS